MEVVLDAGWSFLQMPRDRRVTFVQLQVRFWFTKDLGWKVLFDPFPELLGRSADIRALTAWIAVILSQASLRNVERQRCWKRGSGDGQKLCDYCTARLSDLSMQLTSEVRRSPEPSARPSAAADSEERQICTTCLFTESVGLCLCFLPSCAMYKDNAVALGTW